MDQVALYLQDAHPISEGIELVRYAESKGFDAVWQADSRLVRDAVVPMAAFAATTDRIKIGSGVIDIWTRNAGPPGEHVLDARRPRARAASSAGSARGGTRWPPKVGIDRDKPLRVMREVVDRGARPARQRDRHASTATTSTSTASSSTTCTRSGGPRTCRSTSAPPACR